MVVVAVLKTGLVLQQAIKTPDARQCEITRPLIEAQIRRAHPEDVDRIHSICMEFER